MTYNWPHIVAWAAAIVALTTTLALAPTDSIQDLKKLPDAERYLDDPLAVPPVKPRRAGSSLLFWVFPVLLGILAVLSLAMRAR